MDLKSGRGATLKVDYDPYPDYTWGLFYPAGTGVWIWDIHEFPGFPTQVHVELPNGDLVWLLESELNDGALA